MATKTIEERERLLDSVEDVMLRGFDRPSQVIRMVAVDPPLKWATAERYIEAVRARWNKKAIAADREALRQQLIAEAREVIRRNYAGLASAQNHAGNTFNAQASFLRSILAAQERIAKLTGLDMTRIELDIAQESADALADQLLSSTPARNGLRALRGLSDDPRQERPDGAVHDERAPASDEGDQAPSV